MRRLFHQLRQDLYSRRAIPNDAYSLATEIILVLPVSRMHQMAFEGLQSLDRGPAPMAQESGR